MIKNKDRLPEVEWLPDAQVRTIGTVGGVPLVLLGFAPGLEAGQPMPVVARSYESDPLTESLFALSLHEVMLAQDPVIITEDLG